MTETPFLKNTLESSTGEGSRHHIPLITFTHALTNAYTASRVHFVFRNQNKAPEDIPYSISNVKHPSKNDLLSFLSARFFQKPRLLVKGVGMFFLGCLSMQPLFFDKSKNKTEGGHKRGR